VGGRHREICSKKSKKKRNSNIIWGGEGFSLILGKGKKNISKEASSLSGEAVGEIPRGKSMPQLKRKDF